MLKYLTNAEYRFFHRKLYSVQASIWEAQFKVKKSREVREGVRQDRDRAVEAVGNITKAIETEKDEEKKTKLEAELLRMTENVKRYEAQMKMIDDQVNGSNGSETEEPVIGVLEQIKSLVELKQMYKAHMKTL